MSVTSIAVGKDSSLPQVTESTRPLRVLQVISSVCDAHGGGTTAMWATLQALQGQNVHADLATTDEDGYGRVMNVSTEGEFTRHKGHRVRFFHQRSDRYVTSWPMARWLWSRVGDYDVLHIHGLFRFAPVAAAHVALLRGVPYVLSLHNVLGRWGMEQRRPLLKKLSIGLIEGRMLDGAARVHLCSPEELEQVTLIRAIGDPRSRVFPLGLELADCGSDSRIGESGDLAMFEQLAGRTVVLYMSRIHEIKGLDRLITAFADIHRARPDTVLAIAGDGRPPLIAQLQYLAKSLGIAEHVRWLGLVRGREKQELLSRAGVFVLPSHSENFGFAVVEACAAGTPVVTTANVPAGKFMLQAGGGVIYDGTTEHLTRSVLQILAMPEVERRARGRQAAADVRERLSLRNYGESLETLYREVAVKPVPGG